MAEPTPPIPGDTKAPPRSPRGLAILLAAVTLVWLLSGVGCADMLTWVLETVWVPALVPVLWFTRVRFPLTPLLYGLLAYHAAVLDLGGHYTYAHVPAGDWVRDALGLSRNPYDRLGHLTQGFVPAILVRELLLRTSPLRPGRWLFVLCVCVPLAFSAFYEVIEWWVAVLGGHEADAFLGSQGDVWDTQWDMFCALIGAVAALLMLSRVHDRQLAKLGGTP